MVNEPRSTSSSQEMLGYSPASTSDMVERLSKILSEYTEKLSLSIDETEQRRSRQFRIILIFSILLTTIMIFISYITITNPLVDTRELSFFLSYALLVPITFLLSTFYTELTRYRLLRRNVRRNARHLEQVVRRISQIEQHLLLDVANRILLDLRLTEAESLLDYAREIAPISSSTSSNSERT